jgi:glutathione peroxidase
LPRLSWLRARPARNCLAQAAQPPALNPARSGLRIPTEDSRENTMRRSIASSLLTVMLALGAVPGHASESDCPAWLDQDLPRLRSADTVNLCKAAAGKPLLVVNTASYCGYTPQFKGLEALHQKYRDRGLVVVGFPSDDFNQEDADQARTADVCYVNYGVKFTMLAPSRVTGDGANPVFRELARQARAPGWNFNKYLVAPDGRVVRYFGSSVDPASREMTDAIEQLLAGR